jgi:hypothetical protein
MENFYKGMLQAIQGEGNFPKDPIAAEDEIFYRLGELVDENAITAEESMECWTQYIQSVRPDVRVIHLGQTISERSRFYE